MTENDAKPTQDRPLPGHETQSDEMACPKCGRFVGAATKCPYCGAKVEKRMSLVALRWAAVLLSTVGLVLLWLMAKTREPEQIRIGDIETTMNFGVVRLAGEVAGDARPFKNGNGMSFSVDDGTGNIRVFVDQSQRKAMTDAGLVPRRGDFVDFVAQLQASSAGNSARIRSLDPSSFRLERGGAPVPAPAPRAAADGGSPSPAPAPAPRAAAAAGELGDPVPFSAVDESMVGKSVVVEGFVSAVRAPDPNTRRPYVLTLRNGTDGLDIKIWPDQYLQIPDRETLPGSAVRLKAAVKRYQNQVDLSLANGTDLRREASAAPIAGIVPEMAGRPATVRGTVAGVQPPKTDKAPWTVTLADPASGATLAVVYWEAARAAFARQPAEGDVFEFAGKVDVYDGKVQLKVSSGAKARYVPAGGDLPSPAAPAVAAEPAARPRRAAVPVAEITAASDGQYATVEGALSGPSDLEGKGTSYKLSDASGSIVVVFWNTTVPDDLRQKAAAAKRVRVNGKVKDYKGTLEIIPGASGLEILE